MVQEEAVGYRLSHDDADRCCLYVPHGTDESHVNPPKPDGSRFTERLSGNAVRTIQGASVKAAKNGLAFKAFWTFTLSPTVQLRSGWKSKKEEFRYLRLLGGEMWAAEIRDRGLWYPGRVMDARQAVACGQVVLSQEIRRTLDILAHYRDRQGDEREWASVWVAENPPSKAKADRDGEGKAVAYTRNPHVHLLTNWTLEAEPKRPGETRAAFETREHAEWLAFAAYLEAKWGLGMVHMEFINEPLAASCYMLKSAGYISKSAEESRPAEPLAGQRWGITDNVRPIRTVEDVSMPLEAAADLYAARRAAEDEPLTYGKHLRITKWNISGHGIGPDRFLSMLESVRANGWLYDEETEAGKAGMAAAAEWVAALANTPEAERATKAARKAAADEARRAGCDENGVMDETNGDPYAEDPDLADLLPVA